MPEFIDLGDVRTAFEVAGEGPPLLMLHGAGANENSYMDRVEGQLMQLAEQHGYIVVSPLGHTPLGAYGNPLRLPAVFGQDEVAALPGTLARARADVWPLC